MSTSDSNKPSVQYTAFWPLTIIIATVLLISVFELVNLLSQRQQMKAATVQLQKQVQQAQVVNTTLGKISKELLTLSSSSVEAQKIVREFGIKMKAPDVSPAQKPK